MMKFLLKNPYYNTDEEKSLVSPFRKEVEHKPIVLSAIVRESEFRTLSREINRAIRQPRYTNNRRCHPSRVIRINRSGNFLPPISAYSSFFSRHVDSLGCVNLVIFDRDLDVNVAHAYLERSSERDRWRRDVE